MYKTEEQGRFLKTFAVILLRSVLPRHDAAL
jgi:hypothetical protein